MIRTLVYIWAGLALVGVLLIERKPKDSQNGSNLVDQSDFEEVEANPDSTVTTLKTA